MSEKIQVFSELFQREERVAHLTNADRISQKYAKEPFSWAPAFARSLWRLRSPQNVMHVTHVCSSGCVHSPSPSPFFPVSTEGNVTEWQHVCLNVFILTILFARSLLFTFSKPSFSEFCHFPDFPMVATLSVGFCNPPLVGKSPVAAGIPRRRSKRT